MSQGQGKKGAARTRSLRWMDLLWQGASTTAHEENRKDEVLRVFRDLARDSKRDKVIREYVPLEPLWR
jgi:hypothetical protein